MSEEKKEQLSFELKIQEANNLLEKLIDSEITLSDSVKVYKEGMKELEIAQKLLDDAKFQFEELSNK